MQGSKTQPIRIVAMTLRKIAVLAFILASTTFIPAVSAWQAKMRSVTQGRMLMSGALAIATLPSTYVHQQA